MERLACCNRKLNAIQADKNAPGLPANREKVERQKERRKKKKASGYRLRLMCWCPCFNEDSSFMPEETFASWFGWAFLP